MRKLFSLNTCMHDLNLLNRRWDVFHHAEARQYESHSETTRGVKAAQALKVRMGQGHGETRSGRVKVGEEQGRGVQAVQDIQFSLFK